MEMFQARGVQRFTPEDRQKMINNDRIAMGLKPLAGGGTTTTATPATPAKAPTQPAAEPQEDTGKTWGGPNSTKDLNFGHPTVNGTLLKVLESGRVAWADNGKLMTADQWANLPDFQKQKIRDLVKGQQPAKAPAFEKAMKGGNAAKSHTQPKVDNSQVSPMATAAAQMNTQSQHPGSVADRARVQAQAKLTQDQSATVQNLSQRIQDLAFAKGDVIKDLSDPKLQAEAQARLGLMDAQIAQFQHILGRVQGYKPPANLSPQDAAVVADTFRQINAEIPALSDPTKGAETEGALSVLFSHLDNPTLADRRDPAVINQAVTAQNLRQRLDDLLGAKDDLLKDLADPSTQAEAQARMQLLDTQIGQVSQVLQHVEDYHRPDSLSTADARQVADTFSQINDQASDLANPLRNAQAQANLTQLYAALGTHASEPPQPAEPAAGGGTGDLPALQAHFNQLKQQVKAAHEQFKQAYARQDRPALASGAQNMLKLMQDAQSTLDQIEAKVPAAQRTPQQQQRLDTEREQLIRSQTSLMGFLKALQPAA